MQGVVFSQEGIPIKRAADYQKVLDSRWRFMEVHEEVNVRLDLPVIPGSSGTWTEFTPMYYHGLNFEPAFFASISGAQNDAVQSFLPKGVVADKEWIYFYRQVGVYGGVGNPTPAYAGNINLTVFTLPFTENYTAPTEPVRGGATAQSKYGIKFVDDTAQANIDDSGSTGFSADSTKKLLSVHKHGTVTIVSSVGSISHGVGYTPSFLFSQIRDFSGSLLTAYKGGAPGIGTQLGTRFITPLFTFAYTPITSADSSLITFSGPISPIDGEFAYIILKDPMELAE